MAASKLAIRMFIKGGLVEGVTTSEAYDEFVSKLTDSKRYVKPDREPDFYDGVLSFYANEGIACWGSTIYECFYSSKRNQIGIREIKGLNRIKKNAQYLDQKYSKKYKDAVVENVLLRGMEEPKGFGKIPKL